MNGQDDLKVREIEIIRLMADELTNREIAERLYLGVETVRWYAKQIYSKLGVSGRGARDDALTEAQSLGLLDADTPLISARPDRHPAHNLPVELTSFIGREDHVRAITTLLKETRLLTLTGPGGTGKTRLAVRGAEGLLDRFADGVYFVDLAPVEKSEAVASAIATSLKLSEGGDLSIFDAIKRAIGQREMLLVMDNYEHVIEAASLVVDLLTASRNVKVLVTSREPLRVSGEQVYPVPPLELPDEAEATSEAVALFVQRSQAVKPAFRLTDANAAAVVEICRRLDGMPLAIELAAALSRMLTPEAILKRIDDRFQSLKGGSRDAPTRQRTLRNTIDWSYDLLSDGEKMLFARLSVFRGGRSLEAIEAVCGEGLPIDVFDGLASLVDKSMLRQVEDALGEPRFVMLETLQEYAAECLQKASETETLRSKHARYFSELATHAADYLRRAGQEYWFPKLNVEVDNFRTALQWSLFDGDAAVGVRLVADLRDFWFYEGYHLEGLRWTEQALEHLDDVDALLRVDVLHAMSWLAHVLHMREEVTFLRDALEIVEQQGDERRRAWLLIALTQVVHNWSDRTTEAYDEAVALCERGLAIFRRLDDKPGVAQGLNILGNVHRVQENYERSREAYEECLAVCRETGEQRRVSMTLSNLSIVAIRLRQFEEAKQLAYDTIRLSHEIAFTYMMVLQLGVAVPAPLMYTGDPHRAARVLGASTTLMETMNIRQQPDDTIQYERTRAELRQMLGDTVYEAEFETGSGMSLEEAVAMAMAALSD